MKLLYEASNTVEAHMILNLLEQAELSARIDGEYLQGGVGELQAMGVVRVMVDEQDYVDATAIIQEWDTQQPEKIVAKKSATKKGSFRPTLIGFVCGVAAMILYYNTPVTNDGIDYNGDGELDEKWKYINYRISETEVDRNLDGKVDIIYVYDRKGLLESSLSDDDFSGTFETESYYDYGNIIWEKSDTSGDGFKNYRKDFKNGILNKVIFTDPDTRKPVKIQEFDPFFIRSTRLDTTGDGILDTSYEYDSLAEIVTKSKPFPCYR